MASALLFAALMLTPLETPVALDDLIVFADRSRCAPAAPFGRLLDALWEVRGQPRQDIRKAVVKPYRSAIGAVSGVIGNNGSADMTVEIRGTWHGLPLESVTLLSRYGEPGRRVEIQVGAEAVRVRAALAPLGFRFGERETSSATREPGDRVSTVLTCRLNA